MSADVSDADRLPPRRFWLVRQYDVPGVRGTGIVAEGTVWSSGQVALHWPDQPVATSLWGSLGDVLAVHGHGGRTIVEWIDKGNGRHSEHEHIQCVEYDRGAIWVH